MAFHLIASHLQDEREAAITRARLERLARERSPASTVARLRVAVGRRLVAAGHALGGDALRAGPPSAARGRPVHAGTMPR